MATKDAYGVLFAALLGRRCASCSTSTDRGLVRYGARTRRVVGVMADYSFTLFLTHLSIYELVTPMAGRRPHRLPIRAGRRLHLRGGEHRRSRAGVVHRDEAPFRRALAEGADRPTSHLQRRVTRRAGVTLGRRLRRGRRAGALRLASRSLSAAPATIPSIAPPKRPPPAMSIPNVMREASVPEAVTSSVSPTLMPPASVASARWRGGSSSVMRRSASICWPHQAALHAGGRADCHRSGRQLLGARDAGLPLRQVGEVGDEGEDGVGRDREVRGSFDVSHRPTVAQPKVPIRDRGVPGVSCRRRDTHIGVIPCFVDCCPRSPSLVALLAACGTPAAPALTDPTRS